MVGDDPHFSIALPSGRMLCYTVQGEHGFTFNLISNEKVSMNALFFPDSRREEVTWLGSMGIIVKNSGYRESNITALRFVSKKNKIYIGNKVILEARNIEKLTFTGGKLTVSEAPPVEGFKYPSVYVDLHDVGLSFTIKFMNEHLDLFWHSTGHRMDDSHGLIGEQVFATLCLAAYCGQLILLCSYNLIPSENRFSILSSIILSSQVNSSARE